jgi:aminoglycoside phosphotransferase (APT) family kinase protein
MTSRGASSTHGAEAIAFLRAHSVIGSTADPTVEVFGGGVANHVVRVDNLVYKRPLSRLAVRDEWTADPRRVLTAAAAARAVPGIAPEVVVIDEDALVLVERWVPGHPWKADLLAGHVNLHVAAEVGELLRKIHGVPAPPIDGAMAFDQLRLQPYFETAALRRPDIAEPIRRIVRRLRVGGHRLVHGDFSPKNLLVVDKDGSSPQVTVIDWEVAHIGDPAFDVAFLLSHLIAKSVFRPADAVQYQAAMDTFLVAYGAVDEAWVGAIVGGLLVARVDGRSPLEYLDDSQRELLRDAGVALLRGDRRLAT